MVLKKQPLIGVLSARVHIQSQNRRGDPSKPSLKCWLGYGTKCRYTSF